MAADQENPPASGPAVPLEVAYHVVRSNITELASTPGAGDRPVPSCPEWTVRDLVAHLAGNSAGMLGEAPEASGDGVAALLAGWARTGSRVEHLARTQDLEIGRLLMDAFTHELDLRAALGVATLADHPAYRPAFEVVVRGLSWSLRGHGLPAVRLVSDDGSAWVAGAGRPAATVTAPRYHLYRSLTGRRTPEQLAALDWSTDPTPWLPAFFWGPFHPPSLATDPPNPAF